MNAIAGNVAVTAIWATISTVQTPPNFRPPPPAVVSRRRDDTPLVIFIAGRMPVTSVATIARPTPYAIDIGGSVDVIQNGRSSPSFAVEDERRQAPMHHALRDREARDCGKGAQHQPLRRRTDR